MKTLMPKTVLVNPICCWLLMWHRGIGINQMRETYRNSYIGKYHYCKHSGISHTKSLHINKCFSSHLAVVSAQSIEAKCLVENEDVVGAVHCSNYIRVINNLLPTKMALILKVWQWVKYSILPIKRTLPNKSTHINNITMLWAKIPLKTIRQLRWRSRTKEILHISL